MYIPVHEPGSFVAIAKLTVLLVMHENVSAKADNEVRSGVWETRTVIG
jgi:hypothetical protein